MMKILAHTPIPGKVIYIDGPMDISSHQMRLMKFIYFKLASSCIN